MNIREYLVANNYDIVDKVVYVACCAVDGVNSVRNIEPTKMSIQVSNKTKEKSAYEKLIADYNKGLDVSNYPVETLFKFAKLRADGQLVAKASWITYLGTSSLTLNTVKALHIFDTEEEAFAGYKAQVEKTILKLESDKETFSKVIDKTIEEIRPQEENQESGETSDAEKDDN